MSSAPGWLISSRHAIAVWFLLAAVAVAGFVRGPWFVSGAPISTGGVVIFAAPLVQAALFVLLYLFFGILVHRYPFSFDTVRYRRRGDTQNYVPDIIFWIVAVWGVLFSVASVCIHFGGRVSASSPPLTIGWSERGRRLRRGKGEIDD